MEKRGIMALLRRNHALISTNNKKRVTVIEFEKEFINIDLKPIDLTNRKKHRRNDTQRINRKNKL